jgi:hypothetical protein
VEITFRTAAAADVIRKLAKERPQLIVGAGTVLNAANLEAAKASGAAFAVSPGLNPQTLKQAHAVGLPFVPGVATPSDIELGLSLGCHLLKFFPAEANGGVPMIEALSAPYKHVGILSQTRYRRGRRGHVDRQERRSGEWKMGRHRCSVQGSVGNRRQSAGEKVNRRPIFRKALMEWRPPERVACFSFDGPGELC